MCVKLNCVYASCLISAWATVNLVCVNYDLNNKCVGAAVKSMKMVDQLVKWICNDLQIVGLRKTLWLFVLDRAGISSCC